MELVSQPKISNLISNTKTIQCTMKSIAEDYSELLQNNNYNLLDY